MSQDAEQAKQEEQKPQALSTEEVLAKLSADLYETRKQNELMAKAIVELNKKIESIPKQGQGEANLFTFLEKMAGKSKEGGIDEVVKGAESLARLADSLDRFRHPSSLSVGDALAMRAGYRAMVPRYMTKTEIERLERARGITTVLEGEEAEESSSGEHLEG